MRHIGTDNIGFLELTSVLGSTRKICLYLMERCGFAITFSFSEPLGKECDKMFIDPKAPAPNSWRTTDHNVPTSQYIFTRML